MILFGHFKTPSLVPFGGIVLSFPYPKCDMAFKFYKKLCLKKGKNTKIKPIFLKTCQVPYLLTPSLPSSVDIWWHNPPLRASRIIWIAPNIVKKFCKGQINTFSGDILYHSCFNTSLTLLLVSLPLPFKSAAIPCIIININNLCV